MARRARRCPPALLGLAALGAAALLGAGCGGEEGVAEGATVRVYVAAPLCDQAEAALDGPVGEVEVEAVCLARQGRGERLDLATVGANARRATEDSTAVGYLEEDGRAGRFSRPIVAEANLAWSSGAAAIPELRAAIEAADRGSMRASVRGEIN